MGGRPRSEAFPISNEGSSARSGDARGDARSDTRGGAARGGVADFCASEPRGTIAEEEEQEEEAGGDHASAAGHEHDEGPTKVVKLPPFLAAAPCDK